MARKPNDARAPSRPAGDGSERICVARIGAAHGVRGEVKFWPLTEDPYAVLDYGPLDSEDGRHRVEVESLRPAKDFLVARLVGVGDRNAAEALRNVELFVSRDRLPAIDADDTWYYADLVGLAAVTPDGESLGTVIALHNFGAGDLLEIKREGARDTLLLPFTQAVVPDVDMANRRMTVVPPNEIVGEESRDGASKDDAAQAPDAER